MKEPFELTKKTPESAALTDPSELPRPKIYTGYSAYADEKDGMHLRDYWRSVQQYQWAILIFAVLCAIVTAVFVARQPDVYEARARVQVDLENSRPALGAAKGAGPNLINDPTYFSTQLQVLTSSVLLRRVVKTLDLEHDQTFQQSGRASILRETWQKVRGMFGLGGGSDAGSALHDKTGNPTGHPKDRIPIVEAPLLTADVPAGEEAAQLEVRPEDMAEVKRLAPYVNVLKRGLLIEPVKDARLQVKETRMIDITYQHPDAQMAAKLVNAIVNAFTRSNLERQTSANASAGEFLQKRIAELQAQIRDGEERLSNYAKYHEIISLDAGQNTVVDRLTGLNRQMLEAENERKTAESAYEAAKVPGAAGALAEGSSPQVAAAEARLADLKQKREQMLVESTEEWVEVKEVNRQISELGRQIKQARTHAAQVVLTNLETRFRQTAQREEALKQAFSQQRAETFAQNDAAINYRILQQEISTNRGLLEGLLQRSKENDVLLAALVGTPNNIHVTDYALVPGAPIGPKRLEAVLLAFLLALSAGVGFALFLSYMDDSINSTTDVERLLRLPALALIPAMSKLAHQRFLRLPAANLFAKRREIESERPLLIKEDARSPLAEAYRQLRTSVLMSTAGRAPQTLLVTSGRQSEGKTTTAVNTAFVLAQTGADVLVIDADMRKPSLHTIFGQPRTNGLSTILSSGMKEQDMLKLIRRHEEGNLYVLPAGPIPPNPAELLGSEQMRLLIHTCQAKFTHIVIDSPPIMMFTDGVLLSSLADGVLLVVNCGKSSREVVRMTSKVLTDVGAKIFGVVLNNANVSLNQYEY